ncbi:MAG: histidinol-phosphatase [Dysgonamonadaceae bacterium]|nr:histidinol-phosphatase [Dysgonamonadaceae bacterium]
MKIIRLLPLVVILAINAGQAQVQNRAVIPDINGYQTLQCDFHTHSVFSDGLVWPTVRVDESWREGLDAISLTEHLEYRPHSKDIIASHDRSYEIAQPSANNRHIILIRGSEITRAMPPGHFNAIFLNDCDALAKEDWRQSFAEAKKQNAFIFWNHPSWDAQQPDTTLWFPEHTEIFNNGWMHGIEVVNGRKYSEEAFQWCLDKKLTLIGTSDIHQPIQTDIDFAGGAHRTMTLVFAKERTAEAIREALDNRRTAVYFNEFLIGEEQYLRSIFENSIEIKDVKRNVNGVAVTVKNNSSLTFKLKKTTHDTEIVYFRDYEIRPHSQHVITVRAPAKKGGDVNFEITNFLVRPGKGLKYSYKLP